VLLKRKRAASQLRAAVYQIIVNPFPGFEGGARRPGAAVIFVESWEGGLLTSHRFRRRHPTRVQRRTTNHPHGAAMSLRSLTRPFALAVRLAAMREKEGDYFL